MGWLKGEAGRIYYRRVRRCHATVRDLFLSQVARLSWVHHHLAERSCEHMEVTKQYIHPCPRAAGVLFFEISLDSGKNYEAID
jgi:hypothetical protein